MRRNQNETYVAFCKRVTNALSDNKISLTEWTYDIFGEEASMYSSEYQRRAYIFFRQFINRLEGEELAGITDEQKLAELKSVLESIKNEKVKVQTANLEYNANIRTNARNELFNEQIVSAIGRLNPIEIKTIPHRDTVGTSALLCISDFHAGSTYEIKGLYNEVVNKYDYDTMCNRMWYLLSQLEDSEIVYDDLTIAILGDCFENILRTASLTKLREPVVDTVIKFSEFLSNWIVEVHNRIEVPVNVVLVGGNHDVIRALDSKPQFEGENLSKIVVEFLKLRIGDRNGIFVDDYSDCTIKTIRGTNILLEHGSSDMISTMNYYENLYNISIDEAYMGHLHSQEYKSAGLSDVGDRMCYRVGSICGVDTYAKKLHKASRASALLVTYTDNGHDWMKTCYLN